MSIFNLFKREPEHIYPGEIRVERNWQDCPETDTTTITIGGQVESAALNAIKLILEGKAHVTRYGNKGKGLRVKRQEGIL
jgi:hypothetical protein